DRLASDHGPDNTRVKTPQLVVAQSDKPDSTGRAGDPRPGGGLAPHAELHRGRAGARVQKGKSTPSVNEKSSLISSLTASCASVRMRMSGLGENWRRARSGSAVWVSRGPAIPPRERSSDTPP